MYKLGNTGSMGRCSYWGILGHEVANHTGETGSGGQVCILGNWVRRAGVHNGILG